MTLFARAAAEPSPFGEVLARYFDGAEDPATLERLSTIWPVGPASGGDVRVGTRA